MGNIRFIRCKNIVAKLFSNVTILEKAIYVIVGVCGLINIGLLFTNIED